VVNESLATILVGLLHPLGIEFIAVEDHIVLRPKIAKSEKQSVSPPIEKPHGNYTLHGTLRDAVSGEVLIGATIWIPTLSKGTMTNAYGFYSLTVPEGKHTARLSYIGYKSKEIALDLKADRKADLSLEREISILPEILIEASAFSGSIEQTQASRVNLRPASVENMPAMMGEGDVVKSLQMVPGIQLFADGSTMFHVRGGSRDQNLILLDEAPIYNPSHLLGLFSTISPEAAKDIKVYKGNIPIWQGGRISSLIDIYTNDGNMKKSGFSGSLGLISTRLAVEGPLKKDRSSFFLSGRFSHIKWFVQQFAPGTSKLYFYDINGKVQFQVNNNNRLYFSFYSGSDYFSSDNNSAITWGNFAATIRWNHIFNSRLFSNTTLYSSKYDYNLFTSVSDNNRWHSSIANLSLKTDFSWFVNPEFNIKYGVSFSTHYFDPGNYTLGSGAPTGQVPSVSTRYANEITAYAGNEHTFYERLSISYGLRFSLWMNAGPGTEYQFDKDYNPVGSQKYEAGDIYHTYSNIEPRIELAYRLLKREVFNLYYTRSVQNMHLITNSISPFTSFEFWLPSGPNLQPQLGDQVGAGWVHQFENREMELSIDGYYKWMHNQIDYKDHASMILNPLIEGELRFGKGWSYGAEIMLRKTKGKLSGWLSYYYARSFRKIQGINNSHTFTAFSDRPHSISVVLNQMLSKRLVFSANWFYSTGTPVTTPSGFYNYNGHTVPLYEARNNQRLPDYHRLDLSLNIQLNRPDRKFKHKLNISIYNVYGRKNPVYVNFNKTELGNGEVKVPGDLFPSPKLLPTQTFIYGFIPSVSYQFKL